MMAVIYTVVEALVAFMSVWSVIGLAGFHSYLVCCNITTNEDVSFLFIFDICVHYMHNSSVTNYFALVAAPSISMSVSYLKNHTSRLHKFFCMLSVAVALSSSDDSAVHNVLQFCG